MIIYCVLKAVSFVGLVCVTSENIMIFPQHIVTARGQTGDKTQQREQL